MTGLLQIVVGLLLAFLGVVLLGPVFISLLQRLGYGKAIRADGPESHFGRPARRRWAGC